MKRCKKIVHVNGNKKKPEVPIFMSDKTDFKTKDYYRDKERHYIMIKRSILEDKTTIHIDVPNTGAPQYKRQMLVRAIKGEINSNTVTLGDFNTPLIPKDTTALISHTSKVMLKILQARLHSTWTANLQIFKLDLEKAKEPETKLPTSAGSSKKQESSRKTSTSALPTTPKPLTMWITTNGEILKEMGIPDHLTCPRRNLYASQEATVTTGHRTTHWFQIGKEARQGCIWSPCLFSLYASWEALDWRKHKLASRLPGEISIISDMQMTPPLWQKVKRN